MWGGRLWRQPRVGVLGPQHESLMCITRSPSYGVMRCSNASSDSEVWKPGKWVDFPRSVEAPLFSPAVGAAARVLSTPLLIHSQRPWIHSVHDLGKEAEARPRLSAHGQVVRSMAQLPGTTPCGVWKGVRELLLLAQSLCSRKEL